MTECTICLSGPEKIERFVKITNAYDYKVDLVHDKYVIDGKSIMGLFALNLAKPVQMVIHSEECHEMIRDLKEYEFLQ